MTSCLSKYHFISDPNPNLKIPFEVNPNPGKNSIGLQTDPNLTKFLLAHNLPEHENSDQSQPTIQPKPNNYKKTSNHYYQTIFICQMRCHWIVIWTWLSNGNFRLILGCMLTEIILSCSDWAMVQFFLGRWGWGGGGWGGCWCRWKLFYRLQLNLQAHFKWNFLVRIELHLDGNYFVMLKLCYDLMGLFCLVLCEIFGFVVLTEIIENYFVVWDQIAVRWKLFCYVWFGRVMGSPHTKFLGRVLMEIILLWWDWVMVRWNFLLV